MLALCAVSALIGCSPVAAQDDRGLGGGAGTSEIVRVPADATLEEAGRLVAPGGLILISEGTYRQTLEVRSDDVTVRGADRNAVIIDGELTRQSGIIGTGKRFTVENLTVRNFLQNGVLVTGATDESGAGVARGPDGYLPSDVPPPVPGYLVQSVTAQNNGLYGIYAFNRTSGVIRDNLASGGSDSGVYIGQCADCDALVEGNVLTSNAVGLEFANASNVVVTGNRIVENRLGISVLSNYLEAHGPSASVRVVGNLIADNNNPDTPAQAAGAFGVGIGLGGTVDAEVRSNRIEGNGAAGVWVTSSEDFAPSGNRVSENVWGGNGIDLVYTPADFADGSGNCFELGDRATAEPDALVAEGCAERLPRGGFVQPDPPRGTVFSEVPFPQERPGMHGLDARSHQLPERIALPDLDDVRAPGTDLLAEAKR